MKRLLLLFMTVLLVVTSIPFVPISDIAAITASAAGESMVVSASESAMTVKLNSVGTKGTAQIVRMDANEYYNGDTLTGLSKETKSEGTVVGSYTCGTNATVSFPRYTKNLEDNVYCKYYVVQNGSILYGPVYTTDIAAPVESVYQPVVNKKGVFCENEPANLKYFEDLGASNTTINYDIARLVLPNEDASGKPIDQSKNGDALPYVSNGKTYYFRSSYVSLFDTIISSYSKVGANINVILLAWKTNNFNEYPKSLIYTTGNAGGIMPFNSSNEKGMDYFIAAVEFLAERYSVSKESGLVKNFVIGNEIDYAYAYNTIQSIDNNLGKTTLDVYMEEYSRTLRLANLAVKKYCKDMTVTVPLTHNWAKSGYESKDKNNGYKYMYNSYAPKDILDWLCEKTAARGNYDWGIAPHCYYGVLSSSHCAAYDTGAVNGLYNHVTNDYNTTAILTYSNLEVLQQYLELSQNRYNGTVRSVYLTESGVSSNTAHLNNNKNKDYERQAAYIALAYYKSTMLDCVKSFSYYRLIDHPEETAAHASFGLITENSVKKPAYTLYKYIDTDKSLEYANKYLSYIRFKKDGVIHSTANGNISSYKDAMEIVKTSYNWDELWDESKISIRQTSDESSNYSLELNKFVFKTGESINVTATGTADAWVGIYKSDDKVNINEDGGKESIYWYYIDKEYNGLSHTSGNTYDIKSGFFNETRSEFRNLPAGEYKVVLFSDDNYTVKHQINIKITDSNASYIRTDKTEYEYGENILVSASGAEGTKSWVGIYKKNDKIPTATSIFWDYIDNSGTPIVIQDKTHNTNSSNPSTTLEKGDYVIYLFKETENDSYILISKTNVTVKNPGKPAPLSAVTYKLDNDTDGFANGVVTVTLSEGAKASDCILFWGDKNGPLKGYSSLQKFKITGKVTTYRFPTHTIIPEGATRLLAFSANGEDNICDTYAEVALPKNSTYRIGDNFKTEFQIVSDIHISQAKPTHIEHFNMFLDDVAKNSPTSSGIFIGGDIADNGYSSQFEDTYNIWKSHTGVPSLHLSIGNHDWMNGNPSNQFQQYVKKFNPTANITDKVYYDEEVNGNYYIYLGGERPSGADCAAYLSDAQLTWLKGKLQAYTEKEPNKPIFILLHQSFYNTVAGSLPGEGWHGVINEQALANVLNDYKNIILFNGHSHWVLDSKSNMFPGSVHRPTAFNTASVAYLWTGYNIVSGENEEGSEGYYVRTYDDKTIIMGRDFVNGVYNPSAIYVVEQNEVKTKQSSYVVSDSSEVFNLGATLSNSSARAAYRSSDSSIVAVDSLGNVSAKKPGVATITITAPATKTKTVSSKTVTIKVADTTQQITASSYLKEYGAKDFNIGATFKGNPAVSYYSSNTKVATVNNAGVVSIKGVGTTNILIRAHATNEYTSAEKTITVTVTKGKQTISVKDSFNKKAGDPAFSLGATTDGDSKLTYTTSNKNVATVTSQGVVKPVGNGTAKITITAPATSHYKKATKTVTVTVGKGTQKISVSSVTKTADVGSFNLGAKLTVGNGALSYTSSDKSVATVSNKGVVTIHKAGVAVITVKAAATSSFSEAKATAKITVKKASQTIKASDITKSKNDKSFDVGAKLIKGEGKLSYKSSNKNVVKVSDKGVVTIVGVGTAKIKITASSTSKYNSATKTIKVVITEKPLQTISCKSTITKTYGSKKFNLGAEVKVGNGKLTYKSSNKDVVTVSKDGKVTIKGVGYAYITVTASETSKYNETKKKILIKVNPQKVSVKSLKKTSSTKATLKWKADKKVSGYIIEYSTSKKFTKKTTKTVTLKKNSTTAKTITGLKTGKTYYVRIRSYKTGDVKVYSSWKSLSIKM